jgi:Protein of unknown function (DUF4242)
MTRTYFVECYWPGVDATRLAATVERLAAENGREGSVRWLDSTLVTVDEIVLSVFEAPSAAAVRGATERAGLRQERIVECVRVGSDYRGGRSRDA